MKILIIGSGGREHAILNTIRKSSAIDSGSEIYAVPSNPGMEAIPVNIKLDDIKALADFAEEKKIDMTIVGPEVPLVLGISDEFAKRGLRIMGVDAKCAKFEGSKDHTKKFLEKYKIPTAEYVTHDSYEKAVQDIGIYGFPMVIKADGLAAGKGVIIAQNKAEAEKALDDIMQKKVFGETTVVIEEFLDGVEASIICFVDGKSIVPLETAQDYKRAYDNDEGLNTGGMGTYSPSFVVDDELSEVIYKTILKPTIDGFISENLNYKGILFVGIMIKNGIPKVLEFNVRFGDPETQVILPRLKTDILDIFNAIIDGKLSEIKINWSDEKAVCVVLASGGYPESYEKYLPITFDENINCDVIHAGTSMINNQLVTDGGRVLNVVAIGNTIEEARKKVYNDISKIHFDKKMYRRDIALNKGESNV